MSSALPAMPSHKKVLQGLSPVLSWADQRPSESTVKTSVHILGVLAAIKLRKGWYQSISVGQSTEDDYEASQMETARSTVWRLGCSRWYMSTQGILANWPWSCAHFDGT